MFKSGLVLSTATAIRLRFINDEAFQTDEQFLSKLSNTVVPEDGWTDGIAKANFGYNEFRKK